MHTNVRYLIHIVEKPYFDDVPQFGQMQFEGRRASFLIACSGDVGIVSVVCWRMILLIEWVWGWFATICDNL